MFHLLVKFRGWDPNSDSIPLSRVFEYTEADVKKRFAPEEKLDLNALCEIPALFAAETGGTGDQVARVGTITRAFVHGNAISFTYSLDPDVPGISNETLVTLGPQLGIRRGQLERTHWSIMVEDLFKVLVKHEATKGPRPKVFNLTNDASESRDVCVMMPFDAAFNDVYRCLQDAVAELGLTCKRADDIWKHDVIIQDVVSLLCESSVVICDLTGKNANVFYETGIAHTLGREVILITQHEGDVPFDLRHIRHIGYLNNVEGRAELTAKVKARLETLRDSHTKA